MAQQPRGAQVMNLGDTKVHTEGLEHLHLVSWLEHSIFLLVLGKLLLCPRGLFSSLLRAATSYDPVDSPESPDLSLKTFIANIRSRGVQKDLNIIGSIIRRHPTIDEMIAPTRMHLFAVLRDLSRADEDVATSDRVTRACLLLILGCTITHDWGDHVDIAFVQSLVDLSLLKECEWVSAFMASMYHDISDGLYRIPANPLGGYVRWHKQVDQVEKASGDPIDTFLLLGETYADWVASTLAIRVEPPQISLRALRLGQLPATRVAGLSQRRSLTSR
ncbi:hypothetical protein JCGZ_09999 [Jatropha curcas]|uniref:Uncharacterized protein n=1 Tax=Jatropha curcas TaxID=180498 RepID=A0A067KLY7_JATCU|nr:hypothetical protein JCGZ_09999 [Jatropha curcas]